MGYLRVYCSDGASSPAWEPYRPWEPMKRWYRLRSTRKLSGRSKDQRAAQDLGKEDSRQRDSEGSDGERRSVAAVCRVLGVARSNVAHRRSRRAWRYRRGRPAVEDTEVSNSSEISPASAQPTAVDDCGRYCAGSAVNWANCQ